MNKEPQRNKKQNNGRNGKQHTPEAKEKISTSMIGNVNAEKYTEEEALKLFIEAIQIARTLKCDFVGEVSEEQLINRHVYSDLVKKYPNLKPLHTTLLSACETNCFRHTKKGQIIASAGIVNLKSNHQWTDRTENKTDITTGGMPFKISDMIEFEEDEEG